MRNEKNKTEQRTRINDQIRISHVMLIFEDQNLGVMTADAAKKIAREKGLDLVEISPNGRPPVCKIMDYSKYKYEKSIKDKEKNKKQKSAIQKEVRLSPSIASNDLNVKINSIKRFIESEYKVFISLKFDKRENAHKDLGFVVIDKIIKELDSIASVENKPKLEGSYINCILCPKNKNT